MSDRDDLIEIRELAESIERGVLADHELARLHTLQLAGHGAALAAALFDRMTTMCDGDLYQASDAAMQSLESMARKHEALACVLMIHLLELVGPSFNHEVFNSLELWILHCKDPAVASELQRLAALEPDERAKQFYLRLIPPPGQ